MVRIVFLLCLLFGTADLFATPVTSGLRLWLDAADTQTLYTDANCTTNVSGVGDNVKCWKGKGPSAFEAINANANSPRLVQDGPFEVLEFTSDQLGILGTNGGAVFNDNENVIETEMFFVARTRTITNGVAFRHNSGGRRYGSHFPWGDGQVYFDVGRCCNLSRIRAPWGGSSSFLHTWNFISDDGAPNYQAIYRDSDLVNSDDRADRMTWGTGPFYLGGNGNNAYQQMNAGEVLIYDRRLTDVERETVQNYLLNKWRRPVVAADDWTQGFTKTITAPSGTDRVLLVAVGGEHFLGRSIAGVTYGNQALTEIIQEETGTSLGASASLWYLDDAGIDAANNTNFNVTYAGGNFFHTDISSAVYTNINQDNPIFTTESIEDGQSFANTLNGNIETTVGGLTVVTGQSGNEGIFGSSVVTQIIESGNSTSHVVGAEVEETAINKNFTITHTNSPRMVVVAAHLRQNVLPAVSNLAAVTDSDTSLTLSWDPEAGVTNYRIAYLEGAVAPSLCSSGTLIDAGFVGTHQVTGLDPATEYSFLVCASDGTNFTNGSSVSATTDTNVPLPPSELLSVIVEANQPDSANFAWVSGGGGTTGFRLAYNLGSTIPADCTSGIQVDLGNTTSFQLTGLSQLSQYTYRICAYNGTPIYTPGLAGSFTTPAVASSTNVVGIVNGWSNGAQVSNIGSGQNRALFVSISREGGSDISGATFGGQPMTLVAQRTQGNLSTETYIINEAGIAAATDDIVLASFVGAIPFSVSYSTIVLENVHQTSLVTSTGVNSINNGNNRSANLNVNNGGFSVVAGAHSNQNRVGSMGTAGWVLGSSLPTGGFASVTGYHPNTAAGTDVARINFDGNGVITMNAAYLELAPPTDPSNLVVDSQSDITANLSWVSGFGTTDSFVLAYQPGAAPANCSSGSTVPVTNTENHALTGLTPSTSYGVRLCSVNVQGVLSNGITLNVLTEDAPDLAPNEILNLVANTVSDSEISLDWDNGGGNTESFAIAYQLGPIAPVDCTSGTTDTSGANTAHPISGLAPATVYSFRVCAVNANGDQSTGLTVSGVTQGASIDSVVIAGNWDRGLIRTIDNGTDRALIFVVSSEDDVDANVIGVTYGGQPLSFAEQASFSTAGIFIRTEIWYLLESEITAANNNEFVVNWSDGNLERRYYAHLVLEDIDQENPLFSAAQAGFAANTNPVDRSIAVLNGGFSVTGVVTQNDGTYNFNNGWTLGSNQSGNGSTLGTAHLVSNANGTEVASGNHTNPAGVSAIAVAHFNAAEAAPLEITDLNLLGTNSSAIELGWLSGGGTTAEFKVAYQLGATAPADCSSGTVISTGVNTERNITGLTSSTLYAFRVCSVNSSGEQSTGLTLSAKTDAAPTQWTGAVSSDWFNALNWSGGVPTEDSNCIIPNVANDPVVNGAINTVALCKNLDLQAPLNLDGSSAQVEIVVYGDLNITGAGVITETNGVISLAESSVTTQTVSSVSTLPNLNLNKDTGGSISFDTDLVIGSLVFSGNDQILNVGAAQISVLSTTSISTGTTVNLNPGTSWLMGNGTSLLVSGGTLNTNGSIDTSLQTNPGYGPSQVNFGVVGGTGNWSFEATGGELNLTGVRLDRLGPAGLRVLGLTDVTSYTGTQFTNLPVGVGNVAFYIDTVGSFPANGSYNAFDFAGVPVSGQNTVIAPGRCSGVGHTFTFLEWFGNFANNIGIASVSDNEPVCTILMETSTSPVTMAKVLLTPFNNSVKLYWETSAEFLHKGFNVYRQSASDGAKVLLNSEPVVSLGLGATIRGEYNFTDSNLINGTEYSYFLEDIPVLGEGVTYGPYKATPIDVPESLARTVRYNGPSNKEVIEDSTELEEEVNEGDEWLAQGVTYRSKPDGSLRIFVTPATLQTATSAFDANFSSTFIQEYSRMDTARKPALPFLTLNIPVEYDFEGFLVQTIRQEETIMENITPEPAPAWVLSEVDQRLVPDWSTDSSVYNSNNKYPHNSYFKIEENSVRIGEKPHLQIKVYPALFIGTENKLNILQDLVVDVDMNEVNKPAEPVSDIIQAKSLGTEAGVRIVVHKSGFHRVSYQDLFNQGLESQFTQAISGEFKLTYKDQVIPVYHDDINAEGFDDGDSLVFKAEVDKTAYGSESHLILTRVAQSDAFYRGEQGLSNAQPGSEIIFNHTQVYEIDDPNQFINDRSLGDLRDHFYWKRLFLQSSDSSQPAFGKFCHPVNITGSVSSVVDVTVDAAMRSNTSLGSEIAAEVYWESTPETRTQIIFDSVEHQRSKVKLVLPSTANSTEGLCISVASFNTEPSEFHILDLDKFTVSYEAEVNNTISSFSGLGPNSKYYIPVDSSKGSFKLFETGKNENYKYYFSGQLADGIYEFNTSSETYAEDTFDIVYDSEITAVSSVSLYENEAAKLDDFLASDLLIVTSSSFKNEFSDFIAHKFEGGITATVVELPWIFDNFGYGQPSPFYIRSFFRYLNAQASSNVKYIMFAMDGTYDYTEVSSNSNVNSSPVFLQASDYSDFASDIWFIKDDSVSNGLLKLSIGRVPVRTIADLHNYLNKVVAFENGDQQPENLGIESILAEDTFIDFQEMSDGIKANVSNLSYTDEYFGKDASPTNVRDEITEAFNNSLFVNYLGHGNEYTIGKPHFEVSDINSMTNSDNLPIFVGLNCLTGVYEQAEGTDEFFGEALISRENAGAVAVLSANTLLSPRDQQAFANQFYANLNNASLHGSRDSSRLGDLFMRSHTNLSSLGLANNQTDSFNLLGDPSLMMPEAVIPYRALSNDSLGDSGGGCGLVIDSKGPPSSGWPIFILILMMPLLLVRKLKYNS